MLTSIRQDVFMERNTIQTTSHYSASKQFIIVYHVPLSLYCDSREEKEESRKFETLIHVEGSFRLFLIDY